MSQPSSKVSRLVIPNKTAKKQWKKDNGHKKYYSEVVSELWEAGQGWTINRVMKEYSVNYRVARRICRKACGRGYPRRKT